MAEGGNRWVYVWDPFVRLFHWSLVVCFAVAYLTGDDALGVHVWFGYAIGLLVATRIVWGFVGPTHARFRDFVYSPRAVFAYLRDLIGLHAKRYLGHSPGGGAMVVTLLTCLCITVATGLLAYGLNEGAGPLAMLHQVPQALPADAVGYHHHRSAFGGLVHSVHELFANFTLGLACVHFSAVLFASFAHHENLIRAMLTGYKQN